MENRIKELRELCRPKMTQERLAELAGCTTATIQKLEVGRKPKGMLLTVQYMRQIAHALDVKPADLLLDDDVPYRLGHWELVMIRLFRDLNDIGRVRFMRIANALAKTVTPNDQEAA